VKFFFDKNQSITIIVVSDIRSRKVSEKTVFKLWRILLFGCCTILKLEKKE